MAKPHIEKAWAIVEPDGKGGERFVQHKTHGCSNGPMWLCCSEADAQEDCGDCERVTRVTITEVPQ